MDRIINWLMQPTSNGATILQVLLLSVFLLIVINLSFRQIEEIIKIAKEELQCENSQEVDSNDISV